MSLIRQIWSLLLGTLVLALLGGMLVNIASARDSLQTELRFKNSENAQLLSLALGQQRGNMGAMQGLLATQFETGSYRSIRLRLADGTAVFARTRDREPALAPSWFVQLLAIESPPGVARVDAGWAWPGSIEVVSDATFGYDDLWRGAWRSLVWLLVVAAASGLVAWTAVRRIRTTLDAAIEQAQALAEGRYITVEEPDVPELRRLCDAMNMTVQRSRALFEAQATQLEALRRQAHCDPMTGLPHRANFMAGLAAFLQRQDRLDGVGLVLVRVADLAGLNLLLGRDSADRALMLVARALQTYPERVQGCFVGRLNGSDFALCLPMRNAAAETARSLAAVLRAGLNTLGSAVHAHLGAVEIHGESSVANLMANADLALARAESRGPFAVELVTEGDAPTPRGEQAWREQLAKALASGDVELGTYPVLDRREQLIHLECLLRVRLDPEQPRETGARWLPLAVRSR
ncbi:MAG TPA: LapD/MoxY N-terminal periplasmic domain-containing protein, partial [Burkholderiaceae bacterium]|nr:LapD/MoxY N-terminal periplasmic domain-containing protein [Burkholderiaceae bacterium]